jgi:hypothetical protein
MSFINEIFEFSLFLPEGVKIDFENTQRASEVKAVKWGKTTKIRDQVFLVREYCTRQTHQELLTILGSDPSSEDSVQYWVARFQSGVEVAKLSRDLADTFQTWQSSFACSYKIVLLPVRVCFHDTSVSVRQLRKRSLFGLLV